MAVVVVISSEQVVISEHARKRCFQLQNTKLTPELMAHVRSSIERTLPQGSVVRIDTYEHDEHHADIRVIHGADIDRLWYICVIDAVQEHLGSSILHLFDNWPTPRLSKYADDQVEPFSWI